MVENTPTEIYEFDGFRLDVAGKVLFFEGKLVMIRPKIVEILTVLIQKRGEIVTKHEFIREVWNNSFVAESGIHRNISMLREIFEKTSRVPHNYIETIPRRGYRFLGTAKLTSGRNAFRPQEESENTIAVLPFKVIPATEEYEYLGLGLADALITRLSNLKQIIVRPTSAVFRYVVEDHDLNRIGQELKVKTVLSGNLFLHPGHFRLSVQHLEVASQKTIWGESFSGELTDFFETEEKIIAQLQETLVNHFNPQNAFTGRSKTSQEAYREYLKARFYYNSRTRLNILKAVEHFERATKLDPNFVEAFAGLGTALAICGFYSVPRSEEPWQGAIRNASKALEISPDWAEAHAVMAVAKLFHDWKWQESEESFLKAIELNPNLDLAHHWYGFFLRLMGRSDEAEDEYKIALKLNPTSSVIRTSPIIIRLEARRYEQVIEEALSELEFSGTASVALHYALGYSYGKIGEYEKALKSLQDAYRLEPLTIVLAAQGVVYAWAKNFKKAQEILGQLAELSKTEKVLSYDFATVYANLGECDKAYALLENSFRNRESSMVKLKIDLDFDPLRRQKRFRDLLHRMKFT